MFGSLSGSIGFDKITQQQWDDLSAGKPVVSDVVRQNKALIVSFGFKDMVLRILKDATAEQLLARLEKERPDLKIGDRANALARIREEMKRVGEVLAA